VLNQYNHQIRNGQKKEDYGQLLQEEMANSTNNKLSNPQGFMLMQLEIYL
jgi:hypothetical protein